MTGVLNIYYNYQLVYMEICKIVITNTKPVPLTCRVMPTTIQRIKVLII